MTATVYLITGANRGIGRGLVEKSVSRDDTTVIAAVRDVEKDSSKSLHDVPKGKNSRVLLVKIDNTSQEDAKKAISVVQQNSIDHIDVVIANAGISHPASIETITEDHFLGHFNTNTLGPLWLFQAALPILQAAQGAKFVYITSTMGSITEGPAYGVPLAAYGASKAAANYLVRIIHRDFPNIIGLAVCPGWAQTDMGNTSASMINQEVAPVPLDVSVTGIIYEIDNVVRTKEARFASHEHIDRQW